MGRLLRFVFLTLCLGAVAEAASAPWPIITSDTRDSDAGEFITHYGPSGPFVQLSRAWQKEDLLEALASDLNRMFMLPVDLELDFRACGMDNAFYKPAAHRIILCLELVHNAFERSAQHSRNPEDRGINAMGYVTFVAFHEVAHALIDVLDLPATGREEDAVDELSTLIMLNMPDPRMGKAVFAAASHYYHQDEFLSSSRFADEHALGQQRAFNIVCLLYGSDPHRYQDLIRDRYLPPRRARRCPVTYRKAYTAWNEILTPYTRQ